MKYQGIVEDITSSEYHTIKMLNEKVVASKSTLFKFNRDREAWKAHPNVEVSDLMKLGSYLDCQLLDPTEAKYFYDKDDNPFLTTRKDGVKVCSSAAAKEWRDAKIEAGCHSISKAEKEAIRLNIKSIEADTSAQALMHNMKPQCAVFSQMEGMPTKCLLDIVPDRNGPFGNALADLKRTIKFHPDDFKWHVMRLGYHWQAAMYLDAWNAEQAKLQDPDYRNEWYFLIACSERPFGCGVAKLGEDKIEIGRQEYRQALRDFKHAIEKKEFKNPYQLSSEIITL